MQEVGIDGAVAASHGNYDDASYDTFVARVNERFTDNIQSGGVPLFATDADGLWPAYLASFPMFGGREGRQYHNCHACKTFIERFGGLVTIDEVGRATSAIWNEEDAPGPYKPAIAAMAKLVRRAKVTGVFLCSKEVWGQPETGPWRHFSVIPPSSIIFKSPLLTASQKMAEKRADFKTVMTALDEFALPMIEQAVTLLQTDSLYRSEKVLGQAEWLRDLHKACAAAHGANRANVVWRAIATAPAGFCHPRSSMIGTLLEDIAAGMAYSEVSRRFAEKMHPLSYQRPQAAPTAGAIAAAEKMVEQLGIARSLPRRFARLDEVQAIWRPAPRKDESACGGVFGHLQPKGTAEPANIQIPTQTMTWEKFQSTVLPTAEQIEFYVHPGADAYTSLTTAVNADAPPILQWDHEDKRNPVSWYVWALGSLPHQFGLIAKKFHEVTAIAFKPSMWAGDYEHHGQGVLFLIEGAKDLGTPNACLFPEILKAELHGVRAVIEAYSQKAMLEGAEEASAAGVILQKGQKWDALVRVTTAGKRLEYRLDRWD